MFAASLPMRIDEPGSKVNSAWKSCNAEQGKHPVTTSSEQPPDRLDPALRERLDYSLAESGQSIEVVITFISDMRIPPFPDTDTRAPRESYEDQAKQKQALKLVDEVRKAREEENKKNPIDNLLDGIVIKYRYWLINGVLAEASPDQIRRLSKSTLIRYIEPRFTPSKFSAPSAASDGYELARELVAKEWGYPSQRERIALLDTGVRADHDLLKGVIHLNRECSNTKDPKSCEDTTARDLCWDHGTGMAAIISGDGNVGRKKFPGVSNASIDSFQIYGRPRDKAECLSELDVHAASIAYEESLVNRNKLIAIMVNATDAKYGALSQATENAFRAGVMTVAAVGNLVKKGAVYPSNNSMAMAVGAVLAHNPSETLAYQSGGITWDKRIKPDVQAPTQVLSASSGCKLSTNGAEFCTSNNALKIHGGTSAAGAFASGMAALIRGWLSDSGDSPDPGQVYAHMVLAGKITWPEFEQNDFTGVGLASLPRNGHLLWGKLHLDRSDAAQCLTLDRIGTDIDLALWWPRSIDEKHRTIDAFIMNDNGTVAGKSTSDSSVFQRARASSRLKKWTLKIQERGASRPSMSQVVYWAAHLR